MGTIVMVKIMTPLQDGDGCYGEDNDPFGQLSAPFGSHGGLSLSLGRSQLYAAFVGFLSNKQHKQNLGSLP
jgi:hypothetical protein